MYAAKYRQANFMRNYREKSRQSQNSQATDYAPVSLSFFQNVHIAWKNIIAFFVQI